MDKEYTLKLPIEQINLIINCIHEHTLDTDMKFKGDLVICSIAEQLIAQYKESEEYKKSLEVE